MTMCGPFCSSPPLGTITVSTPAWTASRTSTHVMSAISRVIDKARAGRRNPPAAAPRAPAPAKARQRRRIEKPRAGGVVMDGLPVSLAARLKREAALTLRKRKVRNTIYCRRPPFSLVSNRNG